MLSPLAKAWGGSFKFNRKFLRNSLLNLKLCEGCTARDIEVCLAASLARGVCLRTLYILQN